jgi:hypothetical protein
MRRARRTDANQKPIVDALREAGASVEVLSDVGRGVPDLLVCTGTGILFLVEIKLPGQKLNAMQTAWHQAWHGEVYQVESAVDALMLLRRIERKETE